MATTPAPINPSTNTSSTSTAKPKLNPGDIIIGTDNNGSPVISRAPKTPDVTQPTAAQITTANNSGHAPVNPTTGKAQRYNPATGKFQDTPYTDIVTASDVQGGFNSLGVGAPKPINNNVNTNTTEISTETPTISPATKLSTPATTMSSSSNVNNFSSTFTNAYGTSGSTNSFSNAFGTQLNPTRSTQTFIPIENNAQSLSPGATQFLNTVNAYKTRTDTQKVIDAAFPNYSGDNKLLQFGQGLVSIPQQTLKQGVQFGADLTFERQMGKSYGSSFSTAIMNNPTFDIAAGTTVIAGGVASLNVPAVTAGFGALTTGVGAYSSGQSIGKFALNPSYQNAGEAIGMIGLTVIGAKGTSDAINTMKYPEGGLNFLQAQTKNNGYLEFTNRNTLSGSGELVKTSSSTFSYAEKSPLNFGRGGQAQTTISTDTEGIVTKTTAVGNRQFTLTQQPGNDYSNFEVTRGGKQIYVGQEKPFQISTNTILGKTTIKDSSIQTFEYQKPNVNQNTFLNYQTTRGINPSVEFTQSSATGTLKTSAGSPLKGSFDIFQQSTRVNNNPQFSQDYITGIGKVSGSSTTDVFISTSKNAFNNIANFGSSLKNGAQDLIAAPKGGIKLLSSKSGSMSFSGTQSETNTGGSGFGNFQGTRGNLQGTFEITKDLDFFNTKEIISSEPSVSKTFEPSVPTDLINSGSKSFSLNFNTPKAFATEFSTGGLIPNNLINNSNPTNFIQSLPTTNGLTDSNTNSVGQTLNVNKDLAISNFLPNSGSTGNTGTDTPAIPTPNTYNIFGASSSSVNDVNNMNNVNSTTMFDLGLFGVASPISSGGISIPDISGFAGINVPRKKKKGMAQPKMPTSSLFQETFKVNTKSIARQMRGSSEQTGITLRGL